MEEKHEKRKEYKFNESRRQAYLEHLRKGHRRHAAAQAVGLSHGTVCHYVKNHPEFAVEIEQAEIDACEIVEAELLRLCCTPGRHQFESIKFWLSRRSRERWGESKENTNQPTAPPTDMTAEIEALKRMLDGGK